MPAKRLATEAAIRKGGAVAITSGHVKLESGRFAMPCAVLVYNTRKNLKEGTMLKGLFLALAIVMLSALSVDLSGQPEQTQPAADGPKSLSLDGVDSYVSVPYSADLNPAQSITIEAWVKRAAFRCEAVVGNGYSSSYWLGFCSSSTRFYHGGGQSGDGTTAISPEVWTHIAVVFFPNQGGTVKTFFTNGQPDPQSTLNPQSTLTPAAEGSPLYIGADRDGGECPCYLFQGLIDELRIWNVARTPEEIQATMYQELNSPLPGLMAVWHFNGDAQDAVGQHHGVLVGNASFSEEGFPPNP